MAKKKSTESPNVVMTCAVERCGYVVYGPADPTDGDLAEAKRLMEGHIRQHEDPEGWKAEHGISAEVEPNPEDEG